MSRHVPLQEALSRLADVDNAYNKLNMQDFDSIKAEWRHKFEAAIVPKMKHSRYISYLQDVPKHCLYGQKARRDLKRLRWVLLALQVPGQGHY
jgi:hypothetical protein